MVRDRREYFRRQAQPPSGPKITSSYRCVEEASGGLRPLITERAPPELNGSPLENGITLFRASGESLYGFMGDIDREDPNHRAFLTYLRKMARGLPGKQGKAVSRYLGLNGSRDLKPLASETGQSVSFLEEEARTGVYFLENQLRGI